MRSVTDKTPTLRKATATGRIEASSETLQRMRDNDLPKKDVLAVARVAAVTAAKNTPDVIPYCHPLPLDSVAVDFQIEADGVGIEVSVEAVCKTGVEMEALTAVCAAALTIYDMLKPIDEQMEIGDIRLVSKRGGKSQFHDKPHDDFRAAVVVTSDGTHAGKREDRSGAVIRERLRSYGIEPRYEILPDDEEAIVALLEELVEAKTDLVLTTGGTGLGPRDVTVEATRRVIERELPGVVEAARAYGQNRTPYAMLSRSLAGIAAGTIVVNVPGSSKGAEETLNAIFPAIFHAYPMIRGGGH